MGADQGMGRRPKKSADEQDVFTSWRRVLCWTQRAGATARVKARAHRRDRRNERRELRESL